MPAFYDYGFCVRTPSWHGQEDLLDEYPENWDHARQLAGIEWEPEVAPIAYQTRNEQGKIVWQEMEGHRATVRSDTKKPLGVVGPAWELITHTQMGEFVEALLDQPGVRIDTMLSMKDDRWVAATILLDEPYKVAGDDSETLPYLAVLMSHDGTAANKVVATQTRVVCANTYQAASLAGDRAGRQFVFRHTSGVHDRLEEAREALAGVRDDAQQWRDMAEKLVAMPAPADVVDRFLSEFIPSPPEGVVSAKVMENILVARSTFRDLYEASPTQAAHHGTALGLVNASVEYLDHLRGYNNRDTYMGRQLLRAEPLKAKAVTLARELCLS